MLAPVYKVQPHNQSGSLDPSKRSALESSLLQLAAASLLMPCPQHAVQHYYARAKILAQPELLHCSPVQRLVPLLLLPLLLLPPLLDPPPPPCDPLCSKRLEEAGAAVSAASCVTANSLRGRLIVRGLVGNQRQGRGQATLSVCHKDMLHVPFVL